MTNHRTAMFVGPMLGGLPSPEIDGLAQRYTRAYNGWFASVARSLRTDGQGAPSNSRIDWHPRILTSAGCTGQNGTPRFSSELTAELC
jgi:hypothetical protein